MTTPAAPKSPKSTPTGPHGADRAPDTLTAARPKGDAEGVLSALPFTVLTEAEASTSPGPRPVAWLTVSTPRRRTPTGRSTCACGRDESARGHAKVLALITAHDYHRTVCPLRTNAEGRNAA